MFFLLVGSHGILFDDQVEERCHVQLLLFLRQLL